MMNEIYLIIGHRGTGKTAWIQEVKKYFSKKNQKTLVFDIDQEIQNTFRQTIPQIFEKGESFFRKIENDVVEEFVRKAQTFRGKVFISLGAGYTGKIPSFCKVIHLKRWSDQAGRVFFDRPRLRPHLSSFNEHQSLYSKRSLIYKKQRDFVFTKLDYFKSVEKWDEVFLEGEKLPFRNGVLTLSEKTCPCSQEKLNFFLDQRLKWGLKYFELKDNEISDAFLEKVRLKIPPHQILLSFRNRDSVLFKSVLNQMKSLTVDWPLEWEVDNEIKNHEEISWIYSLHERGHQPLSKILEDFPKKQNAHLKLAVEIFSFEELWQGHLWQKEDPMHRSFHPRSTEGRWKWYRLLFGPHQFLYFIREDYEEGVLDQPVMAESVRYSKGILKNGFACVLGDPIEHSATPYEQKSFFEKYKLSVIPVLMKAEEVNDINIKILENFGMKFSAVTSPLKKKFYQLFNVEKSFEVGDVKRNPNIDSTLSLNTLILTKQGWSGFNTDIDGALAFKQFIHQKGFLKIAVWGGGAVRDILVFVFSDYKNISFYSAQTGKLLKGSEQNPDVVIWAIGRSRMLACIEPPQHWKPLYVLDLNYTEDSPGREYTMTTKAQYLSGWLWFEAQAQAQRILFEKLNMQHP